MSEMTNSDVQSEFWTCHPKNAFPSEVKWQKGEESISKAHQHDEENWTASFRFIHLAAGYTEEGEACWLSEGLGERIVEPLCQFALPLR
jgi:hypothetical protein